MRFALLGDHGDGLAMARALVETGRHELALYAGQGPGVEYLRRWNMTPPRQGDLEEVLADPTIEAVIVAGSPANRSALLRRAMQSERHVLCVHPLGSRPDSGYEAAMLQSETGHLLFPLLPEPLHPGVRKLLTLITGHREGFTDRITSERIEIKRTTAVTVNPLSTSPPVTTLPPAIRLIELERWSTDQVLLDAEVIGHKPGFPGWDVLRFLGGEIAEVMALAGPEEVTGQEPLLLSGRFEHGGLFQMSLLPNQTHDCWRLAAVSAQGRTELRFPDGWPGPAHLTYQDAAGGEQTETFETWNPWTALVDAFESRLQKPKSREIPTWQDAVRCLELDDAARRSVERRRGSTLEYQEATEEASFKGTMTLVGCGILWISLLLIILSAWVPWLGWLIAPVFGVFLAMQLLRWVVPPKPGNEENSTMDKGE